MMSGKLWERYFFKEILKLLFSLLFSFYFLYMIIDYSTHLQDMLKNQKITLKLLGSYYAALFSKRFSLILPFTLLITTLSLLSSFNRRNELLILQTSGISLHRLLRPFFIIASVCTGLIYLNSECALPLSRPFIDQFEIEYFQAQKACRKKAKKIQVIPLAESSYLIYQVYNSQTKELSDVYWIEKPDRIWHMETLSLKDEIPVGTNVDLFFRSRKRVMQKGKSYKRLLFDFFRFRSHVEDQVTTPIKDRSISSLIKWRCSHPLLWSAKKDLILTQIYLKVLIPCLPLLIVLAISPYATRFSRSFPVFYLFAMGIFGYVALFMAIEASVILGEAHVIHPFFAIFTLPVILLLFFGRKFLKIGAF